MDQHNNTVKYNKLRKSFPIFVYESFSVQQNPDGLELAYAFKAGQYTFQPRLLFKNIIFDPETTDKAVVHSMAFHIGMVEMISYWKAMCSPEIQIIPFRLHHEQQSWWVKLFTHGLGEFFYTNGISLSDEKLLSFSFSDGAAALPQACSSEIKSHALAIPVGGGKDSVVTMEMLKDTDPGNRALVINQREATLRAIETAGMNARATIEIDRRIDPLLLKLNEQGFLNGHTPFSALLAFVSLMAAYLNQMGHIALSNESSANEPSIPGTNINHQYSKSLEFEQDFRDYVKQYIHQHVNYFSFLRPLNELQIAALFAGMTNYHNAFRSCNAGSKTDSWCCKCSKCLFTYIILAPFMTESDLTNIFGHNLLNDPALIPILDQLSGLADTKPFECVGTIDEVNIALTSLLKTYRANNKATPVLLKHYRSKSTGTPFMADAPILPLTTVQETGFLPDKYRAILKKWMTRLSPWQETLNS